MLIFLALPVAEIGSTSLAGRKRGQDALTRKEWPRKVLPAPGMGERCAEVVEGRVENPSYTTFANVAVERGWGEGLQY